MKRGQYFEALMLLLSVIVAIAIIVVLLSIITGTRLVPERKGLDFIKLDDFPITCTDSSDGSTYRVFVDNQTITVRLYNATATSRAKYDPIHKSWNTTSVSESLSRGLTPPENVTCWRTTLEELNQDERR